MAQESQPVGQDEIDQLLRSKSAPPGSPTASAAAGSDVLNQDEIEALLAKSGKAPAAGPAKTEPAAAGKKGDADAIPAGDVEYLLRQAQEALASVDAPRLDPTPGLAQFCFEEFGGTPASTETATLEL